MSLAREKTTRVPDIVSRVFGSILDMVVDPVFEEHGNGKYVVRGRNALLSVSKLENTYLATMKTMYTTVTVIMKRPKRLPLVIVGWVRQILTKLARAGMKPAHVIAYYDETTGEGFMKALVSVKGKPWFAVSVDYGDEKAVVSGVGRGKHVMDAVFGRRKWLGNLSDIDWVVNRILDSIGGSIDRFRLAGE